MLIQDYIKISLDKIYNQNKGQAFGLSGIIAQALGLNQTLLVDIFLDLLKENHDGITDMFGNGKNFKIKSPFNFFKKQQATNADIAADRI